MARAREEPQQPSRSAEFVLVSAAAGGDGDAFARIIERHQQSIAAQMRRFARDPNVVEELVHDAFVEAYASLPSFQSKAPLIHWLRKIAVRVGYRYWNQRRQHAQRNVALSQAAVHLNEAVDTTSLGPREASETLGDLLDALPPADRLVLTLIYWDGCSVREAAALAGWSQSKVKVQAHRARKRLRKLIEESLE